MKILLTRPYEDSVYTKGYIESNSQHKCIIEPLLDISYIEKDYDFSDDNIYLITSVNSVRALRKNTSKKDLKLVTVGNSSRREALELGFHNVYSASAKTKKFGEEAMINYIVEKFMKNRKLVHISANVTKGGLETELTKIGYNFERLVLYKSVPVEIDKQKLQKIIADEEIAYSFFSPRTAAIFASQIIKNNLNFAIRNSTAFCFSGNVIKGLKGLDFKEIIVPEEVSKESFLEIIKSY